ncbi:hypothetical protein ACFQMA_09425 [Halosimplex aquaticum]|uniref:DUF8135 domain-containing protein n=1 Tax=Halosimplex aquaticum TaxID=3026162 RepID=A0ABD5XY48_9EURY|nr:hypothetical protein [Halosimplex aquaticum]
MNGDSSPDRDENEDDGDRDPFDSFEGYRNREGDPFDSLEVDSPRDSSGEGADRDPFEYRGSGDDTGPRDGDGERGGRSGDRAGDPSRADAGDPLGDVEVDDGDPFESEASAFERSAVEGIDPDEVWARLTGESTDDGAGTNSESGAGVEAAADETAPSGDGDVAEVSKHAYCEGCEHFSPPPDVACAHEGTEILEFVDVESVRVANCPVVAERRELGDDV